MSRAQPIPQSQNLVGWLYLPLYHMLMAFAVPTIVGYVPFSSSRDLSRGVSQVGWIYHGSRWFWA